MNFKHKIVLIFIIHLFPMCLVADTSQLWMGIEYLKEAHRGKDENIPDEFVLEKFKKAYKQFKSGQGDISKILQIYSGLQYSLNYRGEEMEELEKEIERTAARLMKGAGASPKKNVQLVLELFPELKNMSIGAKSVIERLEDELKIPPKGRQRQKTQDLIENIRGKESSVSPSKKEREGLVISFQLNRNAKVVVKHGNIPIFEEELLMGEREFRLPWRDIYLDKNPKAFYMTIQSSDLCEHYRIEFKIYYKFLIDNFLSQLHKTNNIKSDQSEEVKKHEYLELDLKTEAGRGSVVHYSFKPNRSKPSVEYKYDLVIGPKEYKGISTRGKKQEDFKKKLLYQIFQEVETTYLDLLDALQSKNILEQSFRKTDLVVMPFITIKKIDDDSNIKNNQEQGVKK